MSQSGCWPGYSPMWSSDWGCRIHFQGGPLAWLVYWCRLLAGGLWSSLCGPFPKAGSVSSIYGNCLPPEIPANDPESQDESCNVFWDLALKVTYHHFPNILFVAQVSPIYCERDCIRASTGSHLESWLPQLLINLLICWSNFPESVYCVKVSGLALAVVAKILFTYLTSFLLVPPMCWAFFYALSILQRAKQIKFCFLVAYILVGVEKNSG